VIILQASRKVEIMYKRVNKSYITSFALLKALKHLALFVKIYIYKPNKRIETNSILET
jgi:hypothetical protein